jgi:hypothetical protein
MLRVSDHVRSTHDQDGGVVLDVRHGQMFSLNFIGSKILELLKRGCPEPQIAQEISMEFGVTREIAAADVREFLDTLEKHRLIEVRSSNGPL